ncbi:4Fe-4S single cluster domain-containing protein [Nonomuraea solani]|uniref:4Fe-4S single cluster domain-containing protein n=1 Tax=Nonomuraea solani TaxID=1144553 RepID=A0A1H5W9B2_9ACTN|nr:radical SAM protein [Nonomuraea solani]SEF95781.1 4Fe-4S single cluster domain-containing protein [Nonomuraea solani]
MTKVSAARLTRARAESGATALLFITDRCPVGCGHCSVDSRADSPKITDFALFEQIVDAIAASSLPLIGISGGEPFVERRGLPLAVDRLADAGKELVVYTSGFWGRTGAPPPEWAKRVLRRCSTVVLSTDSFHASQIASERYVAAARAIAEAGTHIVVQVMDMDGMPDQAAALLEQALGADWNEHAELSLTWPVRQGRGETLFVAGPHRRGKEYGTCHAAAVPVVRYDGVVSACCNEGVVMGRGPGAIRRRCRTGEEVGAALDGYTRHAFFHALRAPGFGALMMLPQFADLAEQRFASICHLCWAVTERQGELAVDDPFYRTLSLIGKESAHDDPQ